MDEQPFLDIDISQASKTGQNTCGDTFLSKRYNAEDRLIAVLSDGLGSGIKACILSQMTATMLLKFTEKEIDIMKAAEVMMNSLPVCQVRKISYSTFSVIDYESSSSVKIVEEGNPQFVLMRNNESVEIEPKIITSKQHDDRHLNIYHISLQPEDRLIVCSDGVTQAGMGTKEFKLGWRRVGLIEYTKGILATQPRISSRDLSQRIVREASKKEPDNYVKDDTSCVVLYLREPRKTMIFTGPPYHSDRDREYAALFKNYKGKKVICGGTTTNILARELKRDVVCNMQRCGDLPNPSEMKGVDLVTEGILTLTRVAEYLEDEKRMINDAAGKLVELIMNSDQIDFVVGSKLNQAHHDPQMPIELEIRKTVIKRILKLLEDKFMKKITVQYI